MYVNYVIEDGEEGGALQMIGQMITVYLELVQQMIMVYHDSGGSTQGISSLQIWQKNLICFPCIKSLLEIILRVYAKMITIG